MNVSTRNGPPFLVVVALLEIILVLLPLGARGFAQSEEAQRAWLRSLHSLSSERMLADVTTLSSFAFNGRQTGTTDDASSAKWIADRFQTSGLSLVGDRLDPTSAMEPGPEYGTGLMTTVVTVPKIAPDPLLRISIASDSLIKQLGTDYFPILDTPSAEVRGAIVFVGYGIVDAKQGIDDYAGVDTTNTIILFSAAHLRTTREPSATKTRCASHARTARSAISLPQDQCSAPMRRAAASLDNPAHFMGSPPNQKPSQAPGSAPLWPSGSSPTPIIHNRAGCMSCKRS